MVSKWKVNNGTWRNGLTLLQEHKNPAHFFVRGCFANAVVTEAPFAGHILVFAHIGYLIIIIACIVFQIWGNGLQAARRSYSLHVPISASLSVKWAHTQYWFCARCWTGLRAFSSGGERGRQDGGHFVVVLQLSIILSGRWTLTDWSVWGVTLLIGSCTRHRFQALSLDGTLTVVEIFLIWVNDVGNRSRSIT